MQTSYSAQKKVEKLGEKFPRKNTKSKHLQNKIVEFFVLRIKTRAGTTSDKEATEDR